MESALKDAATTGSLSDAAADLSTDTAAVGTKEEAIAELGDKYNAETDTVTVVVEPYLAVDVTQYDQETNTLTMEIDAYYNVKATTDPGKYDGRQHGHSQGRAAHDRHHPGGPLHSPARGFPTDNTEHLYVRHTKDGRVVGYHEAAVSNGILTFTNDKGFSTFDVVTDKRSVSVDFGSGVGAKTYGPANVGEELPSAAAAAGKVYAGWTFSGVDGTHTSLTDELLTKLAAIGGTAAATAVYRDTGTSDSGSSSGSSGGSSGTVVVSAASNGSVSVSPQNAAKGSTVTITVKPKAGYALDTLSVTDSSGRGVDLTRRSDTQYTFTMPAGTVSVKATFVKEDTLGTADMDFSDVNESYWAMRDPVGLRCVT